MFYRASDLSARRQREDVYHQLCQILGLFDIEEARQIHHEDHAGVEKACLNSCVHIRGSDLCGQSAYCGDYLWAEVVEVEVNLPLEEAAEGCRPYRRLIFFSWSAPLDHALQETRPSRQFVSSYVPCPLVHDPYHALYDLSARFHGLFHHDNANLHPAHGAFLSPCRDLCLCEPSRETCCVYLYLGIYRCLCHGCDFSFASHRGHLAHGACRASLFLSNETYENASSAECQ